MYILNVDETAVSTHSTLDDAFKARNEKVREICLDLLDNGTIDKYAVEDWCFDLDNNREMSFYIDEGCGYSIDIVESNGERVA
jgi:hypothetical protein